MISFEFHLDAIAILPLFTIEHTRCENPACDASHFLITLGWLCFSMEVAL